MWEGLKEAAGIHQVEGHSRCVDMAPAKEGGTQFGKELCEVSLEVLRTRLKATLESVHGGSCRLFGREVELCGDVFIFFMCFSSHGRIFVCFCSFCFVCLDLMFRPGLKEAWACGREKIVLRLQDLRGTCCNVLGRC